MSFVLLEKVALSDISLENDLDDLMASKTSDAKVYQIELAPNWHFTIIDTPGFGDSRGLETDKKHVERIMACLQKVTSINCVMLVMNGRDSRMTTTMKYVIAQLVAVMPRSVLQHVVIAFTNTEKNSKLNFKVACLKEVGLDSPPFECIDNPFGEVHEALADPDDIDEEMLSGFSQDIRRTLHSMEKLGWKVHDMQPVPSNCFAELNEKREGIEALLANNLERISEMDCLMTDLAHAVTRCTLQGLWFPCKGRSQGGKSSEESFHGLIMCATPQIATVIVTHQSFLALLLACGVFSIGALFAHDAPTSTSCIACLVMAGSQEKTSNMWSWEKTSSMQRKSCRSASRKHPNRKPCWHSRSTKLWTSTPSSA